MVLGRSYLALNPATTPKATHESPAFSPFEVMLGFSLSPRRSGGTGGDFRVRSGAVEHAAKGAKYLRQRAAKAREMSSAWLMRGGACRPLPMSTSVGGTGEVKGKRKP